MCLAVPGQILTIDDAAELRLGTVSFGGIHKQVCLAYVPEAKVGDYVLVHVGFALNTIDEQQARQVVAALSEMGELDELGREP